MQELFAFIYRYRAFFLFIGLEFFALSLVFNSNSYQQFAYLTTASRVVATTNQASAEIAYYFSLKSKNDSLALENAKLLAQLANREGAYGSVQDSLTYEHIPAKVINNSIWYVNNYLTIDKGLADGVRPGMGVVTGQGVIGKVKASSEHFSTLYSVLHASMSVSSQLKRTGHLCSTRWDGRIYTEANLANIPMHLAINVGDTILTSGYNAIFPPSTPIGIVSFIERDPSEIFQTVRINLSTNFATLKDVYVVKNFQRAEKDSLEAVSGD